ncbi:hypothetical protein RBSWK_04241 [Rhodopirellula baltica SWK14]|uniref:Uncharacterized protein n=1 Tax=Rhodopirellula baltica SWK14 TaxID=993516 RepID=L7CD00_RHOBT|nr:hypothetical protein RBSWK_04241 [Rhodopirellula baltica SWK14]
MVTKVDWKAICLSFGRELIVVRSCVIGEAERVEGKIVTICEG